VAAHTQFEFVALVVLIWYACLTRNISVASQDQAEAGILPCITVITVPRRQEEAVLGELQGTVGAMVVSPRNGTSLVAPNPAPKQPRTTCPQFICRTLAAREPHKKMHAAHGSRPGNLNQTHCVKGTPRGAGSVERDGLLILPDPFAWTDFFVFWVASLLSSCAKASSFAVYGSARSDLAPSPPTKAE
jgi:hypothetical protein